MHCTEEGSVNCSKRGLGWGRCNLLRYQNRAAPAPWRASVNIRRPYLGMLCLLVLHDIRGRRVAPGEVRRPRGRGRALQSWAHHIPVKAGVEHEHSLAAVITHEGPAGTLAPKSRRSIGTKCVSIQCSVFCCICAGPAHFYLYVSVVSDGTVWEREELITTTYHFKPSARGKEYLLQLYNSCTPPPPMSTPPPPRVHPPPPGGEPSLGP